MTRKGVDLVVFGEVLCDLFAPRPGLPLAEAAALVPHLGGAPANVAVQAARLGVPVALVTAVGPDPFGDRLRRLLVAEGVDVTALMVKPGRRTGVTLVEVDRTGERTFFGFREASADLALTPADASTPVSRRLMRFARAFHSGTVSLRNEGSRDATEALQDAARSKGALISLDVNLRPGMYPSTTLLVERASRAVERADVVKATREEAAQLCGAGRRRLGIRRLATMLLERGPGLVIITDGDAPLCIATRQRHVVLDAIPVKVVDATGAGDACCGAVLATLLAMNIGVDDLDTLDDGQLLRLADVGRRAGAAAVRALGATTGMLRRLPGRNPR
jgi:fructokinase